MRKSTMRLRWTVGAVAALFAWLSSLLLAKAIPLQTSISVWRPIGIFAAQIELRLDSTNMNLISAGTTVVLAVVLSGVIRLADANFRFRAIAMTYGGLAIAAMLSANLLTLALSWALIDLMTLLYGMSVTKDAAARSSLITRVVVDVSGIFLILGTAIVNVAGGGADDLTIPLVNYWATALLVFAVVLRLGLVNREYSLAGLPGFDSSVKTLMRIMPPAAALSILARQFAFGIPEELRAWLSAGSAIGLLIAGMRWMLEEDDTDRQRFFTFGIAFLGILASTVPSAASEAPLVASTMVLLIVGSIGSLTQIHSPWHRVFPAIGAVILIMPVWAVGAKLVQGLAKGLDVGNGMWITIVGIIGLAMLVEGLLRDAFKKLQTWYVDDLARLLYSAALILPVMVGFGLGGGTATGVELGAILVTAITASAALGSVGFMQRRRRTLLRGAREYISKVDLAPTLNSAGAGLSWASRLLRGLGEVLEGEGGMLWVFVILLMIQLSVSGGL